MRNRNRVARLAAIFNEDWAEPTQVWGVSVAFGKKKKKAMLYSVSLFADRLPWFCFCL